ncbi:MAG TPA: PDZ domain-containing protein, partial [Bacteroidota bacterium]
MNGRVVAAAILISLCAAGNTSAAQGKSEEKRETGNGKHGWLGVAIQDVTPRLAREKELHVKSGALVNNVTEESPADKAGIREDDVIVEFNGKSVEESDDLQSAVRSALPGDKTSVTFYRGQEKKSLEVTLGKTPRRNFAFSFHGPGNIRVPRIPRIHMFRSEGMLGLTLSDLNRQLGEYFGAPNGRGVLVQEVERKSAGEKAGFRAGDVIVKAGKEDVENAGDITETLDGVKKGDKVEFGILRKGEQKTITVESDGPEVEGMNGFRSFEFQNNATGFERNALKR